MGFHQDEPGAGGGCKGAGGGDSPGMTSGGGEGAPLGGSTAGSGGAVGYMHAAATVQQHMPHMMTLC